MADDQLNPTDRAALERWYGPTTAALRPTLAGLSAPQMSVLDAIAHAEVNQPWDKSGARSGYGETVSNQNFDPSDYTGSHPYQSGKFRTYQGRFGPSTASGRYQETLTTYNDNVRKYGVAGFSPGAQDQRAFLKASDLYQNSGAWKGYPNATGDLTADVTQFGNDPRWWSSAAAPALRHEWTSVPGGLEPNDKTRTWVSNAAYQFGHGSGGLPPEGGSEAQYSAEDAPGLLSPAAVAAASRATGNVLGVPYEMPPNPTPSTGPGPSAGVLGIPPQAPQGGLASLLGGLLGRIGGGGGAPYQPAPMPAPPQFQPLQPIQYPMPIRRYGGMQ